MSDTRAGECIGGPWAGKSYAHWSTGPVPVFKPMMEMPLPGRPLGGLAVQPVEIGRYEWVEGRWLWRRA